MKYMASFIRRDFYFDFCLPELKSVCELLNLKLKCDENFSYNIKSDPFIKIDIPDIEKNAEKIISRTLLTKNIIKAYILNIRYIHKDLHMMK